MDADQNNGNVIVIIGGDGREGDAQSMDQNFPPNQEDVVPANEERTLLANPREEFPIRSLESYGSMVGNVTRFRGGHCKKFFTREGCPWGDECAYLHDEEAKCRESVAITLCRRSNVGYGGPPAAPSLAPPPSAPATSQTLKPSNWRKRICKKWEQSGFCSYGSRCTFAHGVAELRVDGEANPNNQGTMATEVVAATGSSSSCFVPPSNSSVVRAGGHEQVPGRERKKWKGPDKISNAYGDWIDE